MLALHYAFNTKISLIWSLCLTLDQLQSQELKIILLFLSLVLIQIYWTSSTLHTANVPRLYSFQQRSADAPSWSLYWPLQLGSAFPILIGQHHLFRQRHFNRFQIGNKLQKLISVCLFVCMYVCIYVRLSVCLFIFGLWYWMHTVEFKFHKREIQTAWLCLWNCVLCYHLPAVPWRPSQSRPKH